MADKGGKKEEHKMLFDLQGRRRNVVKVVYAVLAVLMGLSLLIVAGPLPFGDIFGGEDAQELAQDQAEERIERVEVKLAKDPEDPALLLNLTRAHLSAGSQMIEEPGPGQLVVTAEARRQFEQAASSWEEYVEATDEPNVGAAQQMANTFLQLAETSRATDEAAANVAAAAEAQKIVAEKRPTVGSLATLAFYTLFTFRTAEAEKFNEEAKKLATSKAERDQLDKQFEESKKRAGQFKGELAVEKRFEQEVKEGKVGGEGQGGEAQGSGEPSPNPFGLGTGVSE